MEEINCPEQHLIDDKERRIFFMLREELQIPHNMAPVEAIAIINNITNLMKEISGHKKNIKRSRKNK